MANNKWLPIVNVKILNYGKSTYSCICCPNVLCLLNSNKIVGLCNNKPYFNFFVTYNYRTVLLLSTSNINTFHQYLHSPYCKNISMRSKKSVSTLRIALLLIILQLHTKQRLSCFRFYLYGHLILLQFLQQHVMLCD